MFEPFEVDPATEGVCQHCHQLIDPAAMHFKRFSRAGQRVAGITPHRWDQISGYGLPLWKEKPRWDAQFLPNTMMTPVSNLDVELNPDARFIDFAPPEVTLFGQTSDGTIGPLGFAKMIVSSGEFDRCTVRRFYERFVGFELNPAVHSQYIDTLVQVYVSGERKIRPFIAWLLGQARFRRGH